MLSFGQTRWLSLESYVNRVIEQWQTLQLYFSDNVSEGKDQSCTTESILQGLRITVFKVQLEFLNGQLHRLNCFKKMFQTAEPMLHHLRSEVLKLLKNILSDFIGLDIVRTKDPLTIDVESAES